MLSARSTTQLVLDARAGDREALGELVSRYRGAMYAVACGIVGPGPDAEDAVQDAALIALRQIDSLRDPAAVGSWLRSVVRNACLMQLRAVRAVPVSDLALSTLVPPSDEPTPEECLVRKETSDQVWHALQQLPKPARTVVYLRYFSSTPAYEQIATECGIPVGTVRSRLNQAKKTLAPTLADREHPSPAVPRRTVAGATSR